MAGPVVEVTRGAVCRALSHRIAWISVRSRPV